MSRGLVAGLLTVSFAAPCVWAQNERESGRAGGGLSVVSPVDSIIKIPEPKRQEQLVFVMKDLLKDVPQKARAEFIGSFMLKDGRIATLDAAPLKGVVSEERLIEILNSLGPSTKAIEEAKRRKTRNPAQAVTLSELLKGVTEQARNHFFDNMMFKDGGVACVDAGRLENAVTKRKLIQILNSMAPAGGARPSTYSKALCGDGWCEESVCSYVTGKWQCRFREGQTTRCYDWCDDLI